MTSDILTNWLLPLVPLLWLGISDLEDFKMKWPKIDWGDTMKTESFLYFKDIVWAISLCFAKQEIIGWINMKPLRCSDFSYSSNWCWKKSNCLIVKTILLNKAAFQKTVSVLWCYLSEHVLVILLVMMIKNIVLHLVTHICLYLVDLNNVCVGSKIS